MCTCTGGHRSVDSKKAACTTRAVHGAPFLLCAMIEIPEDPIPDVTDAFVPPPDDAPAWETSKENAQPLRRGRNAKALSARLEEGLMPTSKEDEERVAFEGRVRAEASSGDPLAPWVEYIRWQQDAAVTGNGLLPLIERCAFTFKDDERYTDDARYLNVWIAYADRVRDAEPLYEYLNDRYIGVTQSAFWQAWAAALEAKGKPEAADKCFTNGLLMKAQPAARLQRAHREFQGRLMKKIMKGVADGTAGAATSKEAERKTLNRLTKKEATGTHRPTTQRPAAPIKPPAVKKAAPAASSGLGLGNFTIFDDSENGEAPAGGDAGGVRAPWETGTATQNSKENSGTVTTWNEPLAKPKKKVSARPPAPAPIAPFDIHVDEELAVDEDEDQEEEGQPREHAPMRLQLAGPSLMVSKEIEELQTNPLARFVEQKAAPEPSRAAHAPAPPMKKGLGLGGGMKATGSGGMGGGGGFTIFCDENAVAGNM